MFTLYAFRPNTQKFYILLAHYTFVFYTIIRPYGYFFSLCNINRMVCEQCRVCFLWSMDPIFILDWLRPANREMSQIFPLVFVYHVQTKSVLFLRSILGVDAKCFLIAS